MKIADLFAFLTDVNWNRASGSATDSVWKKSYSPAPGFLPARPDGSAKRERDRRLLPTDRSRELPSRRPVEPTKLISPAPRVDELEESVNVVKNDEIPVVDDVRPSSSALDADEAEDLSDFSDDVDEILNRDLQVCLTDTKLYNFFTINLNVIFLFHRRKIQTVLEQMKK